MEYFVNGHLQLIPGASKEEMEALYMSERLKRKVHKKGPAPKLLGNERCEICGQLANGFHYNVLSCEGCKGFFRRTIINGIEYTCKAGNNECNLHTAIARQRCQKCRIIKCLKAGMNPHFVRKRKDDSICGPYENSKKCRRPSVIINKLPKDQEHMLNDLAVSWRALGATGHEWTDIRESNNVLEYLACIKGKIIQNFVTKIDSFNTLPTALRTDIISRAGNELTVLYLTKFFHKEYQIIKLDETEIDTDCLCYGFQMDETIVNRIFYYLNKQTSLLDKIYDQTICGIIAGIVLFAPDRGYNYTHYNSTSGEYEDYQELLTDLQSKHTELLRCYLERYRSFQKTIFVDILMMLSTLREVNHEMQRYSSRQLMFLIQRSLMAANPKHELVEPSAESDVKLELLDLF